MRAMLEGDKPDSHDDTSPSCLAKLVSIIADFCPAFNLRRLVDRQSPAFPFPWAETPGRANQSMQRIIASDRVSLSIGLYGASAASGPISRIWASRDRTEQRVDEFTVEIKMLDLKMKEPMISKALNQKCHREVARWHGLDETDFAPGD